MTSLFKPSIVRYLDASGKRVTKNTPGAKKVTERSSIWYTRIKRNGKWTKEPLSKNKTAATILAGKKHDKAEMAKAGIDDRYEEHSKTPLTKHLEGWKASLNAKECTAKHVQMKLSRVQKIFDHCKFVFLSDLSASEVETCLAEFRQEARCSTQTSNHYLASVKQFTRWLHRDKRMREDPLLHLARGNVALDRRHDRRELLDEELSRLFHAARTGPVLFKLSGPARELLYAVAAFTGLRASELASLQPKSFNLATEPATVTVEAGYSKRRRRDVLPLHPDLVERLASWLAEKPGNAPLWPGNWALRNHAGKMMKRDLQAARAAWLDEEKNLRFRKQREDSDFLSFVDSKGCYADFHSLRHSFISRLVRAGVKPKVAQALARHSTITLTMDRYAHLELDDAIHGVQQLASIPMDGKFGCHRVATEMVFDRERVRTNETNSLKLLTTDTVQNGLENRAIETNRDLSNSGEEGIRTLDTLAGISVFETDAALTQVPVNKRRYGKQPPLVVHRVAKDDQLSRLIVAWPTLPKHTKQAILAIVEAAKPASPLRTAS